MSPLPFDIHDFFDTESDSDVSDAENEVDEEGSDSEGSLLEDETKESGDDDSENASGSGEDDEDTDSDRSGSEDDQPAKDLTIPPLLPVPTSHQERKPTLCSICKKLDLTPRRFVVLPGDPETGDEVDDPNIALGLLEDIRKKASNCPFCRLVLAALGPNVPTVGEDGAKVTITMTWNTDGAYKGRPIIRILRPYANTTKGGYIEIPHLFPEIIMLANDAPAKDPRLS